MVHKKITKNIKKSNLKVSLSEYEGNLNFAVQVNDPQKVRKDVLEALREIIIFMQGYETFKKIQEEKIATFTQLHEEIKALNSLINNKLRRVLPRGKLKGITSESKVQESIGSKEESTPVKEKENIEESTPAPIKIIPKKDETVELDDLEHQLSDIESRLKNIR